MPKEPVSQKGANGGSVPLTESESVCPLCGSCGRFSFEGKDLMFGGTRLFRYNECLDCGAIYQVPLPPIEEIAGYYPQGYSLHEPPGREKRVGNLKRAILKYRYGYGNLRVPAFFQILAPMISCFDLNRAIPYVREGKLLDVGCGNGKFLLSMNGLGWSATGVELSDAAVAVCRGAGLDVVQGDLFEAVFESGRFDLVTARHLIEHVPDPGAFVREVARILKPGGRFVVETPNSRALARGWFKANWFANEVPRHLVLFHPDNLKRLVQGQGLKLLSSRQDTTPKMILNSWDYLTGNKGRPSKKRKIRRLLVRPYIFLARVLGRGDFIFQVYEKR